MLNRWFKLIELTPVSVDSSFTNPRMASTSGYDQPSVSSATNVWVDDTDGIESTTTATPTMMPFRKKAITSIERTRKLSILLKHQRYLVSGLNHFGCRKGPILYGQLVNQTNWPCKLQRILWLRYRADQQFSIALCNREILSILCRSVHSVCYGLIFACQSIFRFGQWPLAQSYMIAERNELNCLEPKTTEMDVVLVRH